MTYRYIYKITLTKGKWKDHFYYGQHTTNNLDDDYKGSGTKLSKYYKKYPNDYIKEIISYHKTDEELNEAEYEIIHPWLNNKQCLNLMEGGIGGRQSNETRKKMSETAKKRTGKSAPMYGKHHSDETKKKISISLSGNVPWNKGRANGTKGRHHTEQAKRKISESRKGIIFSDEHRKNLSESLKGKTPWNKGIKTGPKDRK